MASKEYNKQYYSTRKREWRDKHLKRAYGITLEQFELMLAQQKGVCAARGDPPAAADKCVLHVDHCHATDVVRGLLCTSCNTALGALREDPLRMRALEAYIRQFNWIKA